MELVISGIGARRILLEFVFPGESGESGPYPTRSDTSSSYFIAIRPASSLPNGEFFIWGAGLQKPPTQDSACPNGIPRAICKVPTRMIVAQALETMPRPAAPRGLSDGPGVR